MGNVLEFTLGLQVSEFLNNVGLGEGGILSLEGTAEGLKKVMDRVFGAIETAQMVVQLTELGKKIFWENQTSNRPGPWDLTKQPA
jgi:hypothetical protein